MKPGKRRVFKNLAIFCIVFSLLSLQGCSKFNCTRFEKYLGDETDLIAFSYTVADELTESAYPRLMPKNPHTPILVTTFVDNNDLTKTSVFGRIVQEHIASRLVQQGYAIVDIKMTSQLFIEPKSGETILSRELSKINPKAKAQAILVGTISHTGRTMYVSARFVNPVTNSVISSNDYQLCMDDNMLAMFRLQRATGGDDAMGIDEISAPSQSFLNAILY